MVLERIRRIVANTFENLSKDNNAIGNVDLSDDNRMEMYRAYGNKQLIYGSTRSKVLKNRQLCHKYKQQLRVLRKKA